MRIPAGKLKRIGCSPHSNIAQPDYCRVVKPKRMRPLKICWDLGPLVSIGADDQNLKRVPGRTRQPKVQLSRRSVVLRSRRFQTKVRNRRRG